MDSETLTKTPNPLIFRKAPELIRWEPWLTIMKTFIKINNTEVTPRFVGRFKDHKPWLPVRQIVSKYSESIIIIQSGSLLEKYSTGFKHSHELNQRI